MTKTKADKYFRKWKQTNRTKKSSKVFHGTSTFTKFQHGPHRMLFPVALPFFIQVTSTWRWGLLSLLKWPQYQTGPHTHHVSPD